jgi:hypothetical protein
MTLNFYSCFNTKQKEEEEEVKVSLCLSRCKRFHAPSDQVKTSPIRKEQPETRRGLTPEQNCCTPYCHHTAYVLRVTDHIKRETFYPRNLMT